MVYNQTCLLQIVCIWGDKGLYKQVFSSLHMWIIYKWGLFLSTLIFLNGDKILCVKLRGRQEHVFHSPRPWLQSKCRPEYLSDQSVVWTCAYELNNCILQVFWRSLKRIIKTLHQAEHGWILKKTFSFF